MNSSFRKTLRCATLILGGVSLLPSVAMGQKLKERLALQYAEEFDYPRMAAVYEDMVEKGKADPADMRRLAMAYKRMGQYDKVEST